MFDRQKHLESFKENGFVHIEGFMDDDEMAGIEYLVEEVIRDIVPTLEKKDAMYEDYDRPESLKQVTLPPGRSPKLSELQTGEKMVPLVDGLLEEKAVPKNLELFIKPPTIGTPTPPHQDGYYFCLVPNHALTGWLALDDMDEENGILLYVAGSHKAGVLPHGASNVLGFSQGVSPEDLEEFEEPVSCPVRRGDILVHHSLTVHSADGNPSSRLRRALGLVYYGESAKVDPQLQQNYRDSLERQRADLGVT